MYAIVRNAFHRCNSISKHVFFFFSYKGVTLCLTRKNISNGVAGMKNSTYISENDIFQNCAVRDNKNICSFFL